MEIEAVKQKISPILKRAGVRRASLFGSVAKDEARADSDVDILVELDDKYSLLDFVDLKYKLEESLHRKVDMVEYGALKKSIAVDVLASQISIY